jgi:tetratricopeptide (TPR) repeat protein
MDTARRALAGGDLAAVETLCAEALGRAPENGAAWTLLAETALQRNRLDAAIVCTERAVALVPRDPIAHILRAKCLIASGELGQACISAETAARLNATDPESADALGAIFGLLGQHQRAAELFRLAVAARPNVPQYLFNLAATERMIGMLDAAEGHCRAAIELDCHYSLAHYLRADLRIQTPERNHIAEMEGLIVENGLGWKGAVMMHFALAKELEDVGEHARAFAHVVAGSDLQQRSANYDCRADISLIDEIIRTQTRAWLSSLPAGFTASDPVFVVGLPRTGTTLVERIIAGHSAMISVGETGAFSAELRRARKTNPRKPDMADIGGRYVDVVTALRAPGGLRLIDKTLQNYLHCGIIHAALPRAKIILLQRHPMDACWAMYKTNFQGIFSFSYNQLQLAEYYLAYRRLAQHWQEALPPHALMEVRYENIVRDPAAQSRALIEFIGVPWEDGVLNFHESRAPSATASAVQVRRPVYTSSIGNWRRHKESLMQLYARLAREIPGEELA